MRRTPLRLLSVSAVFLLAGCATTLKLSHEKHPVYLSELRAEYHHENPNSVFSDEVNRGQVVKGMDLFGVLASWGYPDKRTRQGMLIESWTYVDADESSGNTIEYVLAFRDGVLQDWYTTRLTSGMVPVTSTAPLAAPPATAEPAGKTVPQN